MKDKLKKILRKLLEALDNTPFGYSLRKLLAIGFFLLTVKITLQYTNETNLAIVLGILTGMITALVITYSVANIKEKGMEQGKSPESPVITEEKR